MAAFSKTAALPGRRTASGAKAIPAALPALFAIFLGLTAIGIVGFAQIDVIHNAAHNTRHANAFPCH